MAYGLAFEPTICRRIMVQSDQGVGRLSGQRAGRLVERPFR